jgi:hypothetical protein
MTRQEFIDGCLMNSAASKNRDIEDLSYWIQTLTELRAEVCPFDDDTEKATEQADKSLYPWREAPDDAKYATTDRYGFIEWWSEKPTFEANSWGTNRERDYFYIFDGGKHIVSDWTNSLEKRPK